MTDMPTSGPNIDEIVEQTLRNQASQRSNLELPDPTPNAMDVHREKMTSVVDTACAVAMETGRANIEQHQAVMRAVQAKRDEIEEKINEYLELIQAVTDQGTIIDDALIEMKKKIGGTVLIEPSRGNGKRS